MKHANFDLSRSEPWGECAITCECGRIGGVFQSSYHAMEWHGRHQLNPTHPSQDHPTYGSAETWRQAIRAGLTARL